MEKIKMEFLLQKRKIEKSLNYSNMQINKKETCSQPPEMKSKVHTMYNQDICYAFLIDVNRCTEIRYGKLKRHIYHNYLSYISIIITIIIIIIISLFYL